MGLLGWEGVTREACEDINRERMVEAHKNQALYFSLDITGRRSVLGVKGRQQNGEMDFSGEVVQQCVQSNQRDVQYQKGLSQ